jgi:hypothetical protein
MAAANVGNFTFQSPHGWFSDTKLVLNAKDGTREWHGKGRELVKKITDNTFDPEEFHNCFAFLATLNGEYKTDSPEYKLLCDNILSTPLPADAKIHSHRIGHVSQGVIEMSSITDMEKTSPKTYGELIAIVGRCNEFPIMLPDGKKLPGYPDSVILKISVKDTNQIYYGYAR